MLIQDMQKQKNEWKRKGWSIPELRGSKQNWYAIVQELMEVLSSNGVVDMNTEPELKSTDVSYSWRTYASFLKGIGLVINKSGKLSLAELGEEFCSHPSKRFIADLIHDRYRIFGEILLLIKDNPKTIEDIDGILCRDYSLNWVNLSNTRRRTDWLEVLGLIEAVGNRKWAVSSEGEKALDTWIIVTPDVIDIVDEGENEVKILPPPTEIADLLTPLVEDPSLHKKRNTYNMWMPSPNRIENLRLIVQYATEKVTRRELFAFIENEFHLKTSSVESMMPFLRADGLLEEVGKNVYIATAAAKAWCESGSDLDLIRIIHANKRFVGEMISVAKDDITRNDIYAEASKYGINTEKSRWIMGLLIEAGILEETQYLHVKATRLGNAFAAELPMMQADLIEIKSSISSENTIEKPDETDENDRQRLFDSLSESARDPMAEGKASGVAFEENIAAMYRFMGFDAVRIGGAGNTDVVIKWKDESGKTITAIVDGKSKSSGTVTHTDVSDVAIETHKEKNDADYVAIVGPGFGGDTIKNFARKKGFALITDNELIDIAVNVKKLGLSLTEIALMFKVPNGGAELEELINSKRRQLEIVSLIVKTFKQEQEVMDSLSARDLYFLLRGTEVSPSLEELINVFELLSTEEMGVLTMIKKGSPIENTTYAMRNEVQVVNRLRALATAIESGLM